MTTSTAHRVYFVNDTGLVDTSTAGTVTDRTPEDPDGYTHPDQVEIVSIDNICEAS